MGDFVANDALLFWEAFACGINIAVIYDFIRIFRKLIPHCNIIMGIEDFIFWNISGVYLFAVIFGTNNGVIRGYFLIGAILGAYTYTKFINILKKPVKKVIMFVNRMKEKVDGKRSKKAKKSCKNKSYKQQKKVK